METTEDVVKLKERLTAAETKAVMLDLLPMPIMQIDKDGTIIYMNPAGVMSLGLFQQEDVVGMTCHDVLQTPLCQTDECLCYQTVNSNDVITGETIIDPTGKNLPIQFTGIPIKDEAGKITGGLVFMLDISEEWELTERVSNLAEAMKQGHLTARGDVERFEGNAKQILQGINAMLDALIGPLNAMADYIERIARGAIPYKIIDEYKGDFNNIKDNLNSLINNLLGLTNIVHVIATADLSVPLDKYPEEGSLTALLAPLIEGTDQLVEEVHRVAKAVITGRLDVRGDATKFQGKFANVVQSVNSMLDTVKRPLDLVTEYVERIASGNIPGRITDEYKGDFHEIKKHLNQCIDVVNSLVTEIVRLAEATSEGLLSIRGDAGKFQGNFAKIVHGINATLDAVADPLNITVEYLDQIAKGNIPGKIIAEYKGDFHKLKNTLNSLIDNVQAITDIANALANGDMSVEVSKWSESDVRIAAFRNLKAIISQLIREIDMLKEAAVQGQLDIRGNANKFPGDFAKIIWGTNATLDAVVGPIHGVAEYIDRLADGNIPAKMTDEYKGDFRKFKNSINYCIDTINEVNNAVASMAEAVARGDLDRRADLSRYKGDWAKIVKGLNAIAEAIVTPIRDIGGVLNRIAAGEITAHVTFRYQGDYNLLKDACHELAGQLQEMRDVLAHLKTAAVNGQIDARGNIQQFKGEFAGMIQGVNDVLNAVGGPLNLTSEYVGKLAKGDIPEKIVAEYKGKFHELKENLNMLIDVTNEVTTIHHAGRGLNMGMKARYPEDVRIMTLGGRNTIAPTFGQDALNHPLQRVAFNLQTMTDEVKKSIGEMQQQDWLRTGLVELSDRLHGELDFSALIKKSITFLAKYVNAKVGALYLAHRDHNNGSTTLQLVSSYDYPRRNDDRNAFKLGEGLVGQAALEKESILFTDVSEEYIIANWGTNGIALRQILVAPITYKGEVKGVIELGTTHEFTKNHLDFLKQARESIAVAFNSAQTYLKIEELLKETQQQAKELQAQREQLQMSNGELESQTHLLHKSEQRLQQQQEELRQTNKELSQQLKELKKQQAAEHQKNLALAKAQQLIEKKVNALEQSGKYQSNFPDNPDQTIQPSLSNLQVLLHLLEQNRNESFTEKQDEFACTKDKTGTGLLAPVNNHLDSPKEESDKTQADFEEMSLRGLADYIEQNFTRIAVERGLYLKVETAEGLPASIRTDRQQVEQIVQNLLSNALKFTKQGGIRIQIDRPATGVALSRNSLVLSNTIALRVSDTGIGIPEEQQQVISRAFQRTGRTDVQQSNKIGSGLSTLQKLSTSLGGEIQLHSQEGKGSTFTLFLPENRNSQQTGERNSPQRPRPDNVSENRILESIRPTIPPDSRLNRDGFVSFSSGTSRPRMTLNNDEETSAEEIKASILNRAEQLILRGVEEPILNPSPESTLSGTEGFGTNSDEGFYDDRLDILSESKSMLIIEDDSEFARNLFDLARERGFKGLVANDGTAGLQLAYQYIPNAIILNIGLLDADGWMIMEQLKANADTRNIPVHFISTQDRTLEAVKMGTVEYLTKPVTSAEALNTAFKKIEESLETPIKSLLIVESDEPTQVGMVELLGSDTIEIITAITGKEAYQLLQTGPFDCTVLDLELPDISGFELLNMIKENPRIAPCPIIVYTAKELTKKEQKLLKKHSQSARIEGVKSQDRLLNEVASFLRQVESELPPEQQEKLRISHDRDTVLNGKTLLLVDGDMRNIPALTNMFEEKGLHVLFVENGKEALKQLDTRPNIDLVLMDMMMPGMDGCKVTQEIRKQPRFKRLPIIALTERAIKDERQKCSEIGINDYLSKPIDTDKLLSVLRVWLY